MTEPTLPPPPPVPPEFYSALAILERIAAGIESVRDAINVSNTRY